MHGEQKSQKDPVSFSAQTNSLEVSGGCCAAVLKSRRSMIMFRWLRRWRLILVIYSSTVGSVDLDGSHLTTVIQLSSRSTCNAALLCPG